MKIRHFTLALLLIICAGAQAQSPSEFSYQAVARDAGGEVLANQSIAIQFRIRQGSAVGTEVYRESHATSTDVRGLFDLHVGGGTPSLGTMAGIEWGNGPYFLEVEIDPSGGTAYTSIGAQELLSVPYAMHANGAMSLIDADGDTKVDVEEGADDDIIRFDMGGTEYFTMDEGTIQVLNTGNSVYMGDGAGANDDYSDNRNVGIGPDALGANSTG